ncbi:MAG: hypothetical protein JJU32_09020 [Phormidium sp. BM_Day4_Bin.17]|nr:hypothetical protein [Phormidium sp. BM_Day4_Bin.17]UCJ11600.1 MAG: hypothetical protein JWS08_17895 [Phormidium sp. PBR-2020]
MTPNTLQTDDTLMQLKLAINRAIARQEKHWGYFQVHRLDDGSMSLDIPSLPRIRCIANLDRDIYKLYWGRAEKPAVYSRKKKKSITDPTSRQTQVQRVYEVMYQLDGRASVRQINRIMAQTIRDRIVDHATAQADNELEPLVLMTEALS